MADISHFLAQHAAPRILVLGDLILDRYTWGNAERVSPEAPVMVLHSDQHEARLGGAASVAALLRGLEAEVSLVGLIGDDSNGRVLQKLLEEAGIDGTSVLTDSGRPTTIKERFIGRAAGRHPHQMLRVDAESTEPICSWLETRLIKAVEQQLVDCQILLISDYAKGVCTPYLLRRLIFLAHAQQVPVLIDPACVDDFSRYQGADLLKPNRIEAARATGQAVETPKNGLTAATQLSKQFNIANVLVTLDSQGMALFSQVDKNKVFPTRKRSVYDITGAGDTVLAVLGLGQAVGLSLQETITLANLAAGLQIERLGVSGISRDELLVASQNKSTSTTNKVVSLDRMAELVAEYRSAGKTIVFTNGCFDLLHVGHIACLEEAAQHGDVLIVGLNSDASVSQLKGPDRPVIKEIDRSLMLAALSCVDHVLVFEDETPHKLLCVIQPDLLVKGGTTDEMIGQEIVEAYGGQIVRTQTVAGTSTTNILAGMTNNSPQFRN